MAHLEFLKRIPQRVVWLGAVISTLVGLGLVFVATAKRVVIVVDGESYQIMTHARTIEGALRAISYAPAEDDRVHPGLDDSLNPGEVIQVDQAFPVLLEVEGEKVFIYTPEDVPVNILAEAGIRLYPNDQVWVGSHRVEDPAQALSDRPSRLRVERAVPITIITEGEFKQFYSAAETLGEGLWEAGIHLREADHLDPSPETPLFGPVDAVLTRAKPLHIEMDGEQHTTLAIGPTVGEALAENGIALLGLDYAVPGVGETLPEDRWVKVVRVEERVETVLEPLPFETRYQPVADLDLDTLQVIDTGQYGVLANQIRIRVEDDVEISQRVEQARLAVEPRPRILGYGTNIVIQTTDTADGRIEYWRAIPVYATSYSPCNSAADRCYPSTFSGKTVRQGVIGVIRSWYNAMPGWPVYVPGYGFATIEDIGAGIAGRDWIDLGYTDEDYQVWHSWVTLYFLTPVPPLDLVPYILP